MPSAEEPRSGADGSSLNPHCGASSSLPISQTETLRLGEDTEHCRVRLTPSPACDVWATPSALALPALKGPSPPKRRPCLLPSSSSPRRGVQTELLGRDLAASPGLPRPRPPICPQGPGGWPAEGSGQKLWTPGRWFWANGVTQRPWGLRQGAEGTERGSGTEPILHCLRPTSTRSFSKEKAGLSQRKRGQLEFFFLIDI